MMGSPNVVDGWGSVTWDGTRKVFCGEIVSLSLLYNGFILHVDVRGVVGLGGLVGKQFALNRLEISKDSRLFASAIRSTSRVIIYVVRLRRFSVTKSSEFVGP